MKSEPQLWDSDKQDEAAAAIGLTQSAEAVRAPAPSSDVVPAAAAPQMSPLVGVPSPRLFDRLSPIRCYNYRTQLTVAGRLATESLEAGNSTVLILDKNAEEALDTLETLGFTLRQALLDRRLDIYYYRHGVRDRTFFRSDYEAIFDEVLTLRVAPVQHVVMIEFDTLFTNTVQAALNNQVEDFCEVARRHDVSVWGLYCPPGWTQDDFLSSRLPALLGKDSVKQAKADATTGHVELSVRKSPAPRR